MSGIQKLSHDAFGPDTQAAKVASVVHRRFDYLTQMVLSEIICQRNRVKTASARRN